MGELVDGVAEQTDVFVQAHVEEVRKFLPDIRGNISLGQVGKHD